MIIVRMVYTYVYAIGRWLKAKVAAFFNAFSERDRFAAKFNTKHTKHNKNQGEFVCQCNVSLVNRTP